MFRKMRRNKQLLSAEETIDILTKGTSGVLAVQGDDDYPYAVPLSYIYYENKIYFHGAKVGHKLDAIRKQPKASFCVIPQDSVVPEEYTTYSRSVIAFGKIHIITEGNDMQYAIHTSATKYHPHDSIENREKVIKREWRPLCMFVLEIEHMTGKETIELIRAKKQQDI